MIRAKKIKVTVIVAAAGGGFGEPSYSEEKQVSARVASCSRVPSIFLAVLFLSLVVSVTTVYCCCVRRFFLAVSFLSSR